MIKKFNKICSLLSAMFLLLLIGGCKNTDGFENVTTTDLRLNIPMLETATRADVDGTVLEDEIYTLRVLIMDKDNKPLHNVLYNKDQLSNLIIEKVPVGSVQFWVIANEASVGMNYDEGGWTVDNVNGVKKLRVNDAKRKYFPKRGSEFDTENSNDKTKKGLPMTWGGVVEVVPQTSEEPQTVNINLVRNVAKINMYVKHSYDKEIQLTNVSFGPFMSDCIYMFKNPGESIPDVPSDATYSRIEYGTESESTGFPISLPGKTETRTLTIYVYPSFSTVTKEPYTLGFESTLGNFPEKPILNGEGKLITGIQRNTILDIYVTISENNLSLNYKVSDWGEETIDVPDFN